jgi:ankyrin repeat protein
MALLLKTTLSWLGIAIVLGFSELYGSGSSDESFIFSTTSSPSSQDDETFSEILSEEEARKPLLGLYGVATKLSKLNKSLWEDYENQTRRRLSCDLTQEELFFQAPLIPEIESEDIIRLKNIYRLLTRRGRLSSKTFLRLLSEQIDAISITKGGFLYRIREKARARRSNNDLMSSLSMIAYFHHAMERRGDASEAVWAYLYTELEKYLVELKVFIAGTLESESFHSAKLKKLKELPDLILEAVQADIDEYLLGSENLTPAEASITNSLLEARRTRRNIKIDKKAIKRIHDRKWPSEAQSLHLGVEAARKIAQTYGSQKGLQLALTGQQEIDLVGTQYQKKIQQLPTLPNAAYIQRIIGVLYEHHNLKIALDAINTLAEWEGLVVITDTPFYRRTIFGVLMTLNEALNNMQTPLDLAENEDVVEFRDIIKKIRSELVHPKLESLAKQKALIADKSALESVLKGLISDLLSVRMRLKNRIEALRSLITLTDEQQIAQLWKEMLARPDLDSPGKSEESLPDRIKKMQYLPIWQPHALRTFSHLRRYFDSNYPTYPLANTATANQEQLNKIINDSYANWCTFKKIRQLDNFLANLKKFIDEEFLKAPEDRDLNKMAGDIREQLRSFAEDFTTHDITIPEFPKKFSSERAPGFFNEAYTKLINLHEALRQSQPQPAAVALPGVLEELQSLLQELKEFLHNHLPDDWCNQPESLGLMGVRSPKDPILRFVNQKKLAHPVVLNLVLDHHPKIRSYLINFVHELYRRLNDWTVSLNWSSLTSYQHMQLEQLLINLRDRRNFSMHELTLDDNKALANAIVLLNSQLSAVVNQIQSGHSPRFSENLTPRIRKLWKNKILNQNQKNALPSETEIAEIEIATGINRATQLLWRKVYAMTVTEEEVRESVRLGAQLNEWDIDGQTLLNYAVNQRYLAEDIVDVLLEEGADPNFCSKDGLYPVHILAGECDWDRISALGESGAVLDLEEADGDTLVDTTSPDIDTAMVCKEYEGYSRRKKADELHTQMDHSFVEEYHLSPEEGTPGYLMNRKGELPIIQAIEQIIEGEEFTETVVFHKLLASLLLPGADINDTDKWGYSALHAAVENGHYGLMQCFLSKGASPFIRNAYGELPIDLIQDSHARRFLEKYMNYLHKRYCELGLKHKKASIKKPKSALDHNPRSLDGSATGRVFPTIQFEGEWGTMAEYRISPDGLQCGFFGMGLTRQRAYHALRNSEDVQVRNAVINTLAFEYGDTARRRGLEEFIRREGHPLRAGVDIYELLDTHYKLALDYFFKHDPNFVQLTFHDGMEGLMDALAITQHQRVVVWEVNAAGQLEIRHDTDLGYGFENVIHLIYVNGNHFNFLVFEPTDDTFSSLFDWSGFVAPTAQRQSMNLLMFYVWWEQNYRSHHFPK